MILVQLFGWVGNAAFFSRFFVQWLASERAGRSITPRAFWWLSVLGAACFVVYLTSRGELVLLTGVSVNGLIYARNLTLSRETSQRLPGAILLGGAVVAAVAIVFSGVERLRSAWDDTPLWFLCSVAGQVPWSSRFVVQWVQSERMGVSHLPRSFWWLSLAGNLFLLSYALHLGDAVLIAGYLPGPLVQVRNLMLIGRRRVLQPYAGSRTVRREPSGNEGAGAPPTPRVPAPADKPETRTPLPYRSGRRG